MRPLRQLALPAALVVAASFVIVDNGALASAATAPPAFGYGTPSFVTSAAWTPSAPRPVAVDHPTVGMGPYAGTPPPNATAPFVAYFCQQEFADECSHSVDGGLTWSPSVLDPNLTCVSLFGHVKVSADG